MSFKIIYNLTEEEAKSLYKTYFWKILLKSKRLIIIFTVLFFLLSISYLSIIFNPNWLDPDTFIFPIHTTIITIFIFSFIRAINKNHLKQFIKRNIKDINLELNNESDIKKLIITANNGDQKTTYYKGSLENIKIVDQVISMKYGQINILFPRKAFTKEQIEELRLFVNP